MIVVLAFWINNMKQAIRTAELKLKKALITNAGTNSAVIENAVSRVIADAVARTMASQ